MSLPDMEAAMSPKGMQPEHMDPMYERTPWLAGLDWAIRHASSPVRWSSGPQLPDRLDWELCRLILHPLSGSDTSMAC